MPPWGGLGWPTPKALAGKPAKLTRRASTARRRRRPLWAPPLSAPPADSCQSPFRSDGGSVIGECAGPFASPRASHFACRTSRNERREPQGNRTNDSITEAFPKKAVRCRKSAACGFPMGSNTSLRLKMYPTFPHFGMKKKKECSKNGLRVSERSYDRTPFRTRADTIQSFFQNPPHGGTFLVLLHIFIQCRNAGPSGPSDRRWWLLAQQAHAAPRRPGHVLERPPVQAASCVLP